MSVRGLGRVKRDEAQIFVANHQSIFDIFAILSCVPAPVRFVAKRELARIPVLAQAMSAAGHVFIDRQDRRKASEAMRKAGERMKRERLSLGLFPEGTRSRAGELGEFKKGTFVLAIETQVPIVPLALDGGYRVASRGRIRASDMTLSVGVPITTEGKTANDRDAVLETVRREIQAMLEAARSRGESSPATGDPE